MRRFLEHARAIANGIGLGDASLVGDGAFCILWEVLVLRLLSLEGFLLGFPLLIDFVLQLEDLSQLELLPRSNVHFLTI